MARRTLIEYEEDLLKAKAAYAETPTKARLEAVRKAKEILVDARNRVKETVAAEPDGAAVSVREMRRYYAVEAHPAGPGPRIPKPGARVSKPKEATK